MKSLQKSSSVHAAFHNHVSKGLPPTIRGNYKRHCLALSIANAQAVEHLQAGGPWP
jgi:hypothetical protein